MHWILISSFSFFLSILISTRSSTMELSSDDETSLNLKPFDGSMARLQEENRQRNIDRKLSEFFCDFSSDSNEAGFELKHLKEREAGKLPRENSALHFYRQANTLFEKTLYEEALNEYSKVMKYVSHGDIFESACLGMKISLERIKLKNPLNLRSK